MRSARAYRHLWKTAASSHGGPGAATDGSLPADLWPRTLQFVVERALRSFQRPMYHPAGDARVRNKRRTISSFTARLGNRTVVKGRYWSRPNSGGSRPRYCVPAPALLADAFREARQHSQNLCGVLRRWSSTLVQFCQEPTSVSHISFRPPFVACIHAEQSSMEKPVWRTENFSIRSVQ